ncbi:MULTISPECIES: SusC/RagA family TonB-linked outer membrane protein [unclassified Myroides]|uniref:SusC/RagA family TonB-linked outer membrane protein n=1 Tax=unclassified Myroides TaxID=2642485 RepID=UPI003D2F650D
MKRLKGTYLKMCFVLGVVTFGHLNLFAFYVPIQMEKIKDVLVFQSKVNSLATIFNSIEEQTKFRVVYSLEAIDTSLMIHLTSKHIKLIDLLNQIEREKEMDYSLSGNLISFKNRFHSKEGKNNAVFLEQIHNIQGNVQDTQGNPLAYTVVRLLHSTIWSLTDEQGNFTLQLEEGRKNPVLSVALVGYESKEIQITKTNSQQLFIQLNKENKSLEEIIITGYSNQVKADYTGSAVQILGNQFQDLPQADIVDMLKGKATGVQVFSENSPGGGNSLAIRGLNTMNTNDPLILIDGVPLVNGLNTINPNDIETILILKDAEASIYGSRAANGVLLITTKKANQTGEIVLEVNSYGGIQYAVNLPKMLNAKEYGQMLWQAYRNDGVLPNHSIYGNNPQQSSIPEYLTADRSIRSADVNWVKEIFTPARIQSHSFSISKGDTLAQQRFGLGYFEQKGILKDTYFKRLNARYNSSYHLLDTHLTVGENFNISYAEQVEIGTNKALNSIVYDAYMYPSIIPIYNEKGNFSGNPINDRQNPLGRLYRNKDNKRKEIRAVGNLFAQATYADFTFRTSLGLDFLNINSKRFDTTFDELFVQQAVNTLATENRYNYQWVFSNTLNFKRRMRKHDVQVVVGQEAIQYYYEGLSASRDNFLQEDGTHWFLDYGTENQLNSGNAYQWNLNSYFAKVNYAFNRKYIFTALVRRDGTSRLKNYRWSNFPALAVGWKVNEENFWPSTIKNNKLMLKLNWGISGNQQVPTYSTVQSFSHNNYNSNYDIEGSQYTSTTGLVSTRVANADLRWESTRQIDAGIEATFFEDKLQIAVDYYTKKTKDLLVYRSLPLTFGGAHKG